MEPMPDLYLSRLILNSRNREVRKDLADCHKLHQRIMTGFPTADGASPRAEFGVLYRPEVDSRSGIVSVLVQSLHVPDWSRLPHTESLHPYLLPLPGLENPAVKPIGAAIAGLRLQDQLRFRLRANPTKRLATRRPQPREDPLLGKRVALLREEEQLAWLHRHAEQAGFAVLDVQVRPDRGLGAMQTGEQQAAERRRLTFGAVVFDGRLQITDLERFRQALCRGIGSGKAYGFGLLSLARI